MNNREQPRYRQIAERLRAAIAAGKFKPGDALPTEMSLCDRYDISRHTAREALRILIEDGLIARRQGAGSIVTDRSQPVFTSTTGDFESIMQYAREATFVLVKSTKAKDETLRELGLDGEYRAFTGLRQIDKQPPLAITIIYVAAAVAPKDETIDHLRESVSEWIESHHDVRIEKIEQRIDAVALTKAEANHLDVATGTPALRTVRRYRDASGNVVLLSQSLHPTGRFAYTMQMERRR